MEQRQYGEYVNPEGIEAYIADEVFYEAVKQSYHIECKAEQASSYALLQHEKLP